MPALRAPTDTQKQIAALQATVERVAAIGVELPGMGMVRRVAGGQAPESPEN